MSARMAGAAALVLSWSTPVFADPPLVPFAPVVPAAPAAPKVHSEAMLRGGVVLTFFGGIGAATGGVLLLASSFGCPDRCEDSASRGRALGATMLGIGTATLAAGIVLIVIGNQKPPVQKPTALLGYPRSTMLGFTF